MTSSAPPMPLARFALCFVTAALTAWPAPMRGAVQSFDGGPKVPVVDVHTHVFNCHDLPMAGILNSQGVPLGVSQALAKVLNSITKADDLEDDSGVPKSVPAAMLKNVPDVRKVVSYGLLNNLQQNLDAPEAESLLSVLSKQERDELLEYVGSAEMPADAAPAEAETEEPALKSLDALNTPERDLETIARALEKAKFPPGESDAPLGIKSAAEASRSGYLAFVGVMTEGNLGIATGLRDHQYPDVDFFVHHMMDMERAYGSVPEIPFGQQIHRMARLDQKMGGKFVHFVAFDPFRRKDSLSYVQNGVAAGALGVKFYPPSGYRAAANELPPIPPWFKPGSKDRWLSRYKNLTPKQLDDFNEKLFAYCSDKANDLPIFTHCTPKGFEADKNYGAMADPKFWEIVLKKHPKLRLCFGHSGGHAFWFPSGGGADAEALFGASVVRLCLEYENVYCEVGYLDQVLKGPGRELFKNKLKEQINRVSAIPSSKTGKPWKFGHKMMYGSDWHMIHKEKNHEIYLDEFNKIFADPVLKPWQRAFFCRNAVDYLRLRERATSENAIHSTAQKQFWRDFLIKVDAGPPAGLVERP